MISVKDSRPSVCFEANWMYDGELIRAKDGQKLLFTLSLSV